MNRSHLSDLEPRSVGIFVVFFFKASPLRKPFDCFSALLFFIVVIFFYQVCFHISSYLCRLSPCISYSFHLFCLYLFNFCLNIFFFLFFSSWLSVLPAVLLSAFFLYLLPSCPVHFFLFCFPFALCAFSYSSLFLSCYFTSLLLSLCPLCYLPFLTVIFPSPVHDFWPWPSDGYQLFSVSNW